MFIGLGCLQNLDEKLMTPLNNTSLSSFFEFEKLWEYRVCIAQGCIGAQVCLIFQAISWHKIIQSPEKFQLQQKFLILFISRKIEIEWCN